MNETAHVCGCVNCQPELYPQGERQGNSHVAVRFGERFWRATIDGEQVDSLTEAKAGEHGFVVFYPRQNGARHVCVRCKPAVYEVCTAVRHGRVELEYVGRPYS